MKTISITEFQTLVARNDWHRDQSFDKQETLTNSIEKFNVESDETELVEINRSWGFAYKKSTLLGITITYYETYNYNECDPDSLTHSSDGQNDAWSIDSVTVIDEDGEKLNAHDLADYLDSDFSSIDYSELEIEQVINIDVDEDSDMETTTLEIDNEPNVRFTGELIGCVKSSDNNAMGSSYSGKTGRWTELALYKTIGGKFICHQIGRTRWVNEKDRFTGKVCETPEEVIEFFGHRWLAKELYNEANIDDVRVVE